MAKLKSPGMQEQLQECAQRFAREVMTILVNASLDDLMRLREQINAPAQEARPARATTRTTVKRAKAKAPKRDAAPQQAPASTSSSGRRDTTLVSGRRPPDWVFPPAPVDSEPPVATREPKVQAQAAFIREIPEGDATRYVVNSHSGTEIASSLQRKEAVREAAEKGFTVVSLAPPPSGPDTNNPA